MTPSGLLKRPRGKPRGYIAGDEITGEAGGRGGEAAIRLRRGKPRRYRLAGAAERKGRGEEAGRD